MKDHGQTAYEARFPESDRVRGYARQWAELGPIERQVWERTETAVLEAGRRLGPRYRHKVRGSIYTLTGLAIFQTSYAVATDGSAVAVYRGDDGSLWARPMVEFSDGRFEEVEP